MYQPYRGQRTQRHKMIRNIIIAVLSVFITACVVFLLFFQDSFREWKEDYVKSQLQQEKLLAQKAEAEAKQKATETQKDTAGQKAPKEEPAAAKNTVKTLEIPQNKLSDAAYLQQVIAMYQQGKINAAAILMKESEGTLNYPSSIPALKGTAVLKNTTSNVPTALKTLKDAGVHMTAVLYTYKDNLYPRQNPQALLKTKSGKPWIHNTKRCMDPSSDAAFGYVKSLVRECGTLGFDEVMLKSFGWPAEGSVQKINYGANADPAARAVLLTKQLTDLKTIVPSVQVSVYLEEPLAANGQSVSGQNLTQLYPQAAHIYLPMQAQTATSGDDIITKLSAQTGGDTSKLVPVYSSSAVAPTLFSGTKSMYFDPGATKGSIDAYAAQTK